MNPLLLVATGNEHKRQEIEAMLAPWSVRVETASAHGAGEVEEVGETFEANALLKACAAWRVTGQLALADDSGLMVDALGGAPGVYSARYAGPAATDADNNRKLIAALAGVADDDRGAAFRSCVAIVVPSSGVAAIDAITTPSSPWSRHEGNLHGVIVGAIAYTCEGKVPGRIVDAPKGDAGFGYDPHFHYAPLGRTFAELSAAEKHAISHRGRAMAALAPLFAALFGA